MPWLRYKNHLIPYIMVRSRRAKHLRIEWQQKYAKITAPFEFNNQQIIGFLFKQSSWLAKHHRHAQKQNIYADYIWPANIHIGERIPYLGKQLTFCIEPALTKAIDRQGDRLCIKHKQEQPEIEALVFKWLQQQAYMYASYWSKRISKKHNLIPRSITIKDQKSRWGSCGIHDDIYLNWRLMCCPLAVFYYVVVHEHCHLQYRNHGKRYWKLVGKIMPTYKVYDNWLAKYSHVAI